MFFLSAPEGRQLAVTLPSWRGAALLNKARAAAHVERVDLPKTVNGRLAV